jgi:lysozyme family protein
MADFSVALAKTLQYEGGYSNDAHDAGGETYRGISRVHNPFWSGWIILDRYKKTNMPIPFNTVDLEAQLKDHVEIFYDLIWDQLELDGIENQELAENLFDVSVNMGMGRAVKFLQEAMNIANKNQSLWQDVLVDGGFGPNTKKILAECKTEHEWVAKLVNGLRIEFYIEIVRKNAGNERFIRGWLKRAIASF